MELLLPVPHSPHKHTHALLTICFHGIPDNFQVKHLPLSAQDKVLVTAVLSLWRRAAEAMQLMAPILTATASLGKPRKCIVL